jgi:CHAT domain-containing protein
LFGLALEQLRSAAAPDVLLALERLRRLEGIDNDAAAPEEAVRGQLARVQAAQPSPDDSLSKQTARDLQAFIAAAGWSSGAPGAAELDAARAALAPDSMLLSHFFAGDELLAVTAGRQSVRLHRLGDSGRVRKALEAARVTLSEPAGDIAASDFDRLGRWLLEPVLPASQGTIYLMPFGPLIGFPLDALRVEGRYAIEQHRFAYVESLAAAGGRPGRLQPGFEDRVFVAGNPRAGRDLFSYGVSTSEEITAVRDRFVGDGLTIVQGVALRGDEFEDERVATAGLVHLAMPGRIDLSHPGRSRLLLSGEREQPAVEFLAPASIRRLAITAGLGVLSGTATHARPRTDLDSRLGLVHDLHAAGAPRVIAALWPLGDEEKADFMARFYDALIAEGDVVEALVQTRRAVLASADAGNFRAWAGFQLYIR